MRLRDREADNIKDMRQRFGQEFELAEDTLDLAARIFSNRRLTPPDGDDLVGRIALGLTIKMIHVLWAIIAAAERALPTSSLVRELAEALISLAYLLKEDSSNRAQLYADRLVIQAAKDLDRRLSEPALRDEVTPEIRQAIESKVQPIRARRGDVQFDEMRRWGSWGGNFSVEIMARKAGLPAGLYAGLYATESRAPHALDIASHVQRNPDGSLIATLPALAERHLIPSTMIVVVALDLGTQAFKIEGHKDAIAALNTRVGEIGKIEVD